MKCDSEELVEAIRLVEEIEADGFEQCDKKEQNFIETLSDAFNKYGEKAFLSLAQLDWLRKIHERVI